MLFTALVLSIVMLTHATEYTEQDSFFLQRQKHLINEYRICTGDYKITDIDSLLRWKNIINIRTEMAEYKKILKEFIQHTGMVKEALPCQVLNWHLERLRYLKHHEDSLQNELLKKSDYTVDSIRVHYELENNPISKFDFIQIPFGLSKKVFMHLFTQKLSYPLINKKRYLLIEHYPLNDNSFLVKFYFNRYKKYYKYEIEGYAFSGDQLNDIVRPQATLLKDILAREIGPPDRLYRIGYFDVKSGIITPYVKWIHEGYTTNIGLSIRNNRYFTRQTVIFKKLVDDRFRYKE